MSAQVAPYQHALAWNLSQPAGDIHRQRQWAVALDRWSGRAGSVCSPTMTTHFQNLNAGSAPLPKSRAFSKIGNSPYTMMAGLGANGTAGVKTRSGPTAVAADTRRRGWPGRDRSQHPAQWYVNNSAGVSIYRCSKTGDCTPMNSAQARRRQRGRAGRWLHNDFTRALHRRSAGLHRSCCSAHAVCGAGLRTEPNGRCQCDQPHSRRISGLSYCSGDAFIRSIAALPIAGGGEVIYVGMFSSQNGGAILGGHILKATLVPGAPSQPQWTDLTVSPVANSQLSFNH